MLRRHPRIGLIEVARRLGVARGTVQARLDKLQARGVVTGFGPDVEPAEMGYPVMAFVALEIVQGRLDEAIEGLRAVPEVLEAHGVTGNSDILCRVVARQKPTPLPRRGPRQHAPAGRDQRHAAHGRDPALDELDLDDAADPLPDRAADQGRRRRRALSAARAGYG